jgi:DNA repair exonuclease SbcCD ATPase subunit
MASIINSISFKNFFNYYGDYSQTRYDFEEGVNIVVADNGAGKSKFFNAFLWLFNDQILDSDDKIKKGIKDIAVKIISDKAKSETPLGDSVETGIQIEYSTTRFKYQIIKSFTATRISESITSFDSWQITINDVEVNRNDHILPRYSPVYDADEKLDIIKQLIRPDLRQYSFFQGEEVDSIIDFSKKSSIEEAVRTLTDISKYEELVVLTKDFKDKAEKDLNKQTKSSSEHNERLDKAIKLKQEEEAKLLTENVKLAEFEKLYDAAEQEKNELEQNYSNAEKIIELDEKIKDKNRKYTDVGNEYNTFLDNINNRFFDGNFSWISLGFDTVVNDFQSKIQKFRELHYEKKALLNISNDPNKHFHFLPVNSPDSVSLKSMIDDQHCYVCDRPALEGTQEYDFIVRLKNRPVEIKNETEYVKNNLDTFFSDLQINAQPFYNKISNIDDSILQTRNKENDLNERVTKLKKELKSLKDQRKDILISGSNGEDSVAIRNRYKGAIRRIADASFQIERLKDNKKRLENNIRNTEKEIQLMRPSNIEQGYVLNYNITRDLAVATENAKDRVFDNMVSLLEKYANKHFQHLIKYNDLAGGILKFEKSLSGSILFNYIDSKGNNVHGGSEGFQRMKKFSVVMAVISANKAKYNYPLLADAPLSAFGSAFTEGFFEAISTVFPQSIILVNDLYENDDEMNLNELGKKIIQNDYIKRVYINKVDKEKEQIERTTDKIKLK